MANQVTGLLSPWLREQRLKAAIPHLRGSVLDYGCGVGLLAEHCQPAAYLGVDIDEESIALAKKRYPDFRFEQRVPDAETFDTVVALAVIEHVPDPTEFLHRCARLLNPGGHIVLTTPHPAVDRLHDWGARIGLFSAEAHEEHVVLINYPLMRKFGAEANLIVETYKRFLLGANQLFVLRCA